ncbi:MAG: efflux RND transporter periplasmic adaptor subunit [Nitrospinae bacterium]|nr:efflux RND transporter periplasmic adaptor subunit [Nitrospinota bacterium]
MNASFLRFLTLFLFLVTLFACSDNTGAKKKNEDKEHLVETATVVSKNLSVVRSRTGTLKAKREIQVLTQEEGRIIELPFSEGDIVKKGDVIVRLDDELLASQLGRAKATRKQALLDVERLQKLKSKRIVSEDELNRALTALALAKADEKIFSIRLGYTVIHAPIDGIISQKLTEPGNIVGKHSHVLSISDHSSLYTELPVSELIVPHLRVGDEADVSIDALGSKVYKGKISRIFPNLDATTRRGTIEVELNPVPEGARPGQLCRVQLNTNAAIRQVIPFSALRRDTKGEYVFHLKEDSTVERVDVISGLRLAERVEIIQGLKDGQEVVTRGFLGLSQGKKVKKVSP